VVGTPRRKRVASGRAKRARRPTWRGPRAAVVTTASQGLVAPGRARRDRWTAPWTTRTEEDAAPRRVRATPWWARRLAQRPTWRRASRVRGAEWASSRAQRRPAASTARRERLAHRGTMPTVQVPNLLVPNRAPLLVGVAIGATSTVTTIDGPRPLKRMRMPSIVAIPKAGGGGGPPRPRVRHGGGQGALRLRYGRCLQGSWEFFPRVMVGRRGGRNSRGTRTARDERGERAKPPHEGPKPGVRVGRHKNAGTKGWSPAPPEDATHAQRQAPTHAREHCDRSLKLLCVAADHNASAALVGLRPAQKRLKADQRAGRCTRNPQ